MKEKTMTCTNVEVVALKPPKQGTYKRVHFSDGTKYSCFNNNLFFQVGKVYEILVEQKGQYENLTNAKEVGGTPTGAPPSVLHSNQPPIGPDKGEQINRSVAFKAVIDLIPSNAFPISGFADEASAKASLDQINDMTDKFAKIVGNKWST